MARAKIKPKIVDVGRGPQLARIPYSDGGVRKELPPEGAMVDMDGAAGSYWRRRLNEGTVELADEPKAKVKKEGN